MDLISTHLPAAEVIFRAPQSGSGGLDDQVYNRLLKERIIFLGSVVEDSMANAICAQILLLAAEDPEKDIYLYINSPGGSVTAGMAIYDTMQYVNNDVATVGMGLAASMGQFLLCAGAAGKRYATPHARIMMHQPSSGIGGTATQNSLSLFNSGIKVTSFGAGVVQSDARSRLDEAYGLQ